jgi:hypothetical protein
MAETRVRIPVAVLAKALLESYRRRRADGKTGSYIAVRREACGGT